jgi:hypothetical protein
LHFVKKGLTAKEDFDRNSTSLSVRSENAEPVDLRHPCRTSSDKFVLAETFNHHISNKPTLPFTIRPLLRTTSAYL